MQIGVAATPLAGYSSHHSGRALPDRAVVQCWKDRRGFCWKKSKPLIQPQLRFLHHQRLEPRRPVYSAAASDYNSQLEDIARQTKKKGRQVYENVQSYAQKTVRRLNSEYR